MMDDRKWALNCVMLAKEAIATCRFHRAYGRSKQAIRALDQAAYFRRRAVHYLKGGIV